MIIWGCWHFPNLVGFLICVMAVCVLILGACAWPFSFPPTPNLCSLPLNIKAFSFLCPVVSTFQLNPADFARLPTMDYPNNVLYILPCRPFIFHDIFPQAASTQIECCKLTPAMQKPTTVTAQLQAWPSSRDEGNQKVISEMHAEGFDTHNSGLWSSEGFMSACCWIWHELLLWLPKTLSPVMYLAKYLLYMNWSNVFLTSGESEREKNECEWMWRALPVGFILASPLFFNPNPSFFLFLLFFFFVFFLPLFTSFCHVCGLYFDVWWLNVHITPIVNLCVPPQQTGHRPSTSSSMNCVHWRMNQAPARQSKTASSSMLTTDAANGLNTEAVGEMPTISRR